MHVTLKHKDLFLDQGLSADAQSPDVAILIGRSDRDYADSQNGAAPVLDAL